MLLTGLMPPAWPRSPEGLVARPAPRPFALEVTPLRLSFFAERTEFLCELSTVVACPSFFSCLSYWVTVLLRIAPDRAALPADGMAAPAPDLCGASPAPPSEPYLANLLI